MSDLYNNLRKVHESNTMVKVTPAGVFQDYGERGDLLFYEFADQVRKVREFFGNDHQVEDISYYLVKIKPGTEQYEVPDFEEVYGVNSTEDDAPVVKIEKDVKETTTSDAIAYAPGGMRNPTPEEMALIKGDADAQNKDTEKRMLKKRNERVAREIKEDIDSRVPKLREAILKKIEELGNTLHYREFVSIFRPGKDSTPKGTAVKAATKYDDMKNLERQLPESIGSLELIYNALKKNKTIAAYEPFDAFSRLYGATAVARVDGGVAIYEGEVDNNLVVHESVYIDDVDMVEKVANALTGVKTSANHIYPNGGLFAPGQIGEIYELITEEK